MALPILKAVVALKFPDQDQNLNLQGVLRSIKTYVLNKWCDQDNNLLGRVLVAEERKGDRHTPDIL